MYPPLVFIREDLFVLGVRRGSIELRDRIGDHLRRPRQPTPSPFRIETKVEQLVLGQFLNVFAGVLDLIAIQRAQQVGWNLFAHKRSHLLLDRSFVFGHQAFVEHRVLPTPIQPIARASMRPAPPAGRSPPASDCGHSQLWVLRAARRG